MVQMMPSSFVEVVIRFRSRLEKEIGDCYVEALEEEHRPLCDRYVRDPPLKAMLKSMMDTIGYHDAWVLLHSQSPDLCEFSSGLATIYWTVGVESDFDTWLGEERVS
jgi:hypothetical protein